MKIKTAIKKVEKRISDGTYDYLVNINIDPEFSIVHIVNTIKDVNPELEGWHLWVIKDIPYAEGSKPEFLQIANISELNFGYQHLLDNIEIACFFDFFLSENYWWNKKNQQILTFEKQTF